MYACLYRPAARESACSDSVARERRARQASALTTIAGDFSPRYERHRDDLVSIDVSGLGPLVGPARAIGEALRREAAARGLSVRVALAGTRTAALVLVHACPGLTLVEPGEEAKALAPVPIGILEKVHDVRPQSSEKDLHPKHAVSSAVSAFTRWGIRTLGELAALPPADLAARLGPPGLVWQAIARGDDVRPLVPDVPEERFESSIELEWPIEGLEPLSFVLTRLLEPVSTRLERRDRGAAVLHVILGLVTRDTCTRSLQLPSPIRDVRTLRTLALLDLEAHPPAAAIDRVTIVVDPTPGRMLQHTLFTRAHPTPEQLSTLLARLGALMGQDRIGAPARVDAYRPGAFAMTPFATDVPPPSSSPELSSAITQALRRCRHPVPARVAVIDGQPVRVTTDRRGFAGGQVLTCAGPWRTSGEWWAGASAAGVEARPHASQSWNRDEWDVALSDGAGYRIFRDRDTDGWCVEAITD